MMMPSMCNKVVCFDLDDTLYKEIEYLKSAYREIATTIGHPEVAPQMVKWFRAGENVFQRLNEHLGINTPIEDYLRIYRNHYPDIELTAGVKETLDELKSRGAVLGLITDGRSVSQMNKIRALGLDRWFEDMNIIISEEFGSDKTDRKNFEYFAERFPRACFAYVGDNPKKDFVVPNSLCWKTIMLRDDGRNIHKQKSVMDDHLPQIEISNIEELLDYL